MLQSLHPGMSPEPVSSGFAYKGCNAPVPSAHCPHTRPTASQAYTDLRGERSQRYGSGLFDNQRSVSESVSTTEKADSWQSAFYS